jgi:hypothetical protein
MEAVDGFRAAVDISARRRSECAYRPGRLGGGVKGTEDELLAELRTVGADEWEQAIADAERDLQETSSATGQKERR